MAQIWTILSNLYSIAGPCVMLLYPLIPIWYSVKLIFVTWLVLPQLRGSAFIYNKFVREQLRLYGYGGHEEDKEVTKPPHPVRVGTSFLGLLARRRGSRSPIRHQHFILGLLGDS
ncbi:hypothetical protein KFK09_014126 [Dendrobium nobile]|uniref:HVA22-like protein n=1 Tax=Dendrobium nobile TaxID=94219 RepID=A0A8T3BAU4_DENNO|nr:hypothetical protein KFK09_014126 [Dendrobium nobile]